MDRVLPLRRVGVRGLLRVPGFARLWAVGGVSNAMRQFEILAAALFTFSVTHSALAVAVVSACRNLPMLLFGAFAGVVSESRDRRAILVAAQAVSAGASATIALLAWTAALPGRDLPVALALAALVSGTMWSTEGATRRRMLAETMTPALLPRGFALDSLTNALVRLAGPVGAGLAFAALGLAGAFTFSALCYAAATVLALGVPPRPRSPRPRSPRVGPARPRRAAHSVRGDLAEGLRFAWFHPVIAGVLGVTVVTNIFAFSYSGLVAPLAERHFGAAPALVGLLAAGEPVGALLAGAWLARHGPPLGGRTMMVGGSALFLGVVALMPWMPGFALACLVMVPAGIGTAAFSAMQTALVAAHAPAPIRSRLLGLLTVCIGCGPLGILALGVLAHLLGDRVALDTMALTGLAVLFAIGGLWRRREAAGR